MSAASDAANARLQESIIRASRAIEDRVLEWTDACTQMLNTVAEEIESGTRMPSLDEVVHAAIVVHNQQAPAKFVCSECFHVIGDDHPMIMRSATPSPRMIHWPQCPTPPTDRTPS